MRSILLDIIPRRFRRRSYLVSGTIFLRALLNFAGLALLIPVLLLILDSESMHTNPWLERLYQAGGFESDRAFALTVCGCIVALIAFKNLLNLLLLRYERRYIYDLYRCMSRRLYIEYHDRGLGFIKNTNSALLSRNVNFVCLAFVTGILVPLASITSESMLLALLFTALLFYNPTVAGLVLLVFIPTVWFYYSAVRKRLHRYGVQENEAQREKARTVVETFRGYADLEINDAFPSMLRRFDRAMDKIVTIQSRNMTVNALPSIFMEVGLAIGMALFVAVSLGTPGDEARVLFGVFAVAGLRLMPSVRNMMSGWSALKYNRYTIDILRDIDLNDEKPELSAAQPPLPFEREIAVRDLSFRFDDERGDKDFARELRERAKGYRHYYSKESGTLRPINQDGTFLTPFNPRQGENFEAVPGFHEGSAWNYTFFVPHDVDGLIRLMGGKRKFTDKLQMVMDTGLYDPANEPDIAYPYLFSRVAGEEWRTQNEVSKLLDKYFTTNPDGIPGNDDTGTMSSWAVFSMMGFYPDCPGEPYYTLTSPVFDSVEIDTPEGTLLIEAERQSPGSKYISTMTLGDKPLKQYRISHDDLMKGGKLKFNLTDNHK